MNPSNLINPQQNVSVNGVRRKVPKLDNEHSEAWYDLGAPIYLPTLKFTISLVQYAIDNFFLIKNTYNALVHKDEGEGELIAMDATHPKIIAGCTIGLHVISSIIISVIDSFNKDALSSSKRKPIFQKKMWIILRLIAHLTLTMKLLRYVTVYLENKQRNTEIHKIIQRREQVKTKEISFVVDQRKNSLVESHYDLIESFFKTVPGALLQVYFMFKSNPEAKMRLYSTADQDRFATVFFTVITAAISAANYQADYLAYKKVIIFQESFKTNFKSRMNLKIPGDVCFVSSIPIQFITIGTRICFYCMLIFFGVGVFASTVAFLLFLSWWFGLKWTASSWRMRPILENPLFGTPWVCYDVIDLWIGLFLPGVHYQKFVDHFWNPCIISIISIIIVKGFPSVFLEDYPTSTVTSLIQNQTISSKSLANLSTVEYSTTEEINKEEIYFIGYITKVLLKAHEILTFNQISYAEFFMKVITHVNIANVLCLSYVCVLNGLGYIDTDFPVEISEQIYSKILRTFNPSVKSEADNESLIVKQKNQEEFVVLSMLTNAQFFSVLQCKPFSSKITLNSKKLEIIRKSFGDGGCNLPEQPNKGIKLLIKRVMDALRVTCFPSFFRVAKLNWDVPLDKESLKLFIKDHPLYDLICDKLIDPIYKNENVNELSDLVKCLAVFCFQYNEISKNMTSYRLLKFAQYFSVDLDKTNPTVETGMLLGSRNFGFKKKYYEEGYVRRIARTFRKVDKLENSRSNDIQT